jgi:NitT/TauT family transport system substrate-binding protein
LQAAFCLAGNARLLAQDALKLAVGAKGIWDQSISELAQDAGIFRKHGIVLDIFYTRARARPCRR